MVEAGLPKELIHVKPNFFPGEPVSLQWAERDDVVVYAGRLSSEKGVSDLVAAWQEWGDNAPILNIIGDGPQKQQLLRQVAKSRTVNIRFTGQLSSADTVAMIGKARFLVVPSLWFEGFPMVIREALACGTPVAVSNIGALPSIIKDGVNGIIFEPGSPNSLKEQVSKAWEAPDTLERLGSGAKREFENKYNENANYKILSRIYEQAISVRNKRAMKR
jgi:glycosyltransferase involved in cell wall biosynthesis